MTNEEAIKQLEITKQCDVDTVAQIKALNMAIVALRNCPTGEPLTLEQLRKMDGKPVWVEFEDSSGGLWGIVHISVFEQIVFPNGLHCTIGQPYYGKIYKAYAYPPARIDREGWEPYHWCCCEIDRQSKHCAECRFFDTSMDMEPCKSCENGSNWKYKFKFCPSCGRPQEDEDWAELEKRIGV